MAFQAISDKLSPLRNRLRRLTQERYKESTGSDVKQFVKEDGGNTTTTTGNASEEQSLVSQDELSERINVGEVEATSKVKDNPQSSKQAVRRTSNRKGRNVTPVPLPPDKEGSVGHSAESSQLRDQTENKSVKVKIKDTTVVKSVLGKDSEAKSANTKDDEAKNTEVKSVDEMPEIKITKHALQEKKKPLHRSQESVLSSSDSEEDNYPCDKCGKAESEYLIQCERCNQWVCTTCGNTEAEMINLLSKWKQLHWFCSSCETIALGAVKDSSSNSSNIQSYDLAFKKQMSSDMQSMKKLIEQVIDSTKELKQKSYADMVKSPERLSTVTNVDNSKTLPNREQHNAIDAIDEYIDRERRKCNLIVHNVPENTMMTRDRTEANHKDYDAFKEIVNSGLKIQEFNIKKVTRLGKKWDTKTGKKWESKPRLLLVVLEDESSKKNILSSAKQLRNSEEWGNIFISPDMTPQEREKNRSLRVELRRRREEGEPNLIIRRGRIIVDQSKNWRSVSQRTMERPESQQQQVTQANHPGPLTTNQQQQITPTDNSSQQYLPQRTGHQSPRAPTRGREQQSLPVPPPDPTRRRDQQPLPDPPLRTTTQH